MPIPEPDDWGDGSILARPPLCVTPLEQSVTQTAWQFLAEASGIFPKIYRLAGLPVTPVEVEGVTITKPLTPNEFRTILDRYMCCYRPGRKDADPALCYPPMELVTMMLFDLEAPLPSLRRIVTVPVFDPAGRLRRSAGYDPADGLLLLPALATRQVPAQPTPADVAEARRVFLEDLLVDFPFASEGDRAAAVALILLPFVRDLIAGPTPLHFIEAPTPGTGKGLLATVCLLPGLGERGCSWTTFPEDDDELRKQITTLLMENRGAVLWDNVNRFLKSGALAKLLTDLEWSDRRLGVSASVNIPVRTLWLMTGNNPQMSDEVIRRVVPIRLVPHEERPEERRDFRHMELRTWAKDERPLLIWAAHTLTQAWLTAGRPAPPSTMPPFGSFEAYRTVLGGILSYAGLPGFLENRARLQAFSDPDTDRWRQFLRLWNGRFGEEATASRELMPLAEEAEIPLKGESDKTKIAALGTQLGLRRQRSYAGFRIEAGNGSARRMWRAMTMRGENEALGNGKAPKNQTVIEFQYDTPDTHVTLFTSPSQTGFLNRYIGGAGGPQNGDIVDRGDINAGPGLEPFPWDYLSSNEDDIDADAASD